MNTGLGTTIASLWKSVNERGKLMPAYKKLEINKNESIYPSHLRSNLQPLGVRN